MLKRRLFLVGLALTACNVSSVEPTQSPPTAAETVALPPAFTSTPSPIPSPTFPATPSLSDSDDELQREAMLPEFVGDIDLLPDATRYEIYMAIDFDPSSHAASIDGSVRIRVKNPSDEVLDEIVLRLWPNHDQYFADMEVGPALIEGHVIEPQIFQAGTAVRFALPQAWSGGSWLDLTVPYHIAAGGPIGENIPRRFGISRGVLFAPTAYPIIPPFGEGEWESDRAPMAGDTTNSQISFYHVYITSPADLALVTSGSFVSQEIRNGVQSTEIATGPVRDFALALGPLTMQASMVDGTDLRAWVIADHEHELERILSAAAVQMRLLNEVVGPYPYGELDIVDVAGAFGGIEYPGLVTIGTVGTPFLIRPVVHEVAHQWFYSLIGGDQLQEPWLDEAAASYFEIRYYEEVQGSGTAAGLLNNHRDQLRTHPEPEKPIGLPVASYSPAEYGLFVYLKGALFFDALRAELGKENFQIFLREYYSSFRYGFANAEDFQSTAETVCLCSLDSLFELWVHEGGVFPAVP